MTAGRGLGCLDFQNINMHIASAISCLRSGNVKPRSQGDARDHVASLRWTLVVLQVTYPKELVQCHWAHHGNFVPPAVLDKGLNVLEATRG